MVTISVWEQDFVLIVPVPGRCLPSSFTRKTVIIMKNSDTFVTLSLSRLKSDWNSQNVKVIMKYLMKLFNRNLIIACLHLYMYEYFHYFWVIVILNFISNKLT